MGCGPVRGLSRDARVFNTILCNAAKEGDANQLREVLATHRWLIDVPHPSFDNFPPLHLAAMKGHAEVVELLVRSGSRAIDTPWGKYQWCPMHLAATNGHADVIEVLCRLGSTSIDATDCDGRTPLSFAVWSGDPETTDNLPACAITLKALGADPNACSPFLPAEEMTRLRRREDEDQVAQIRNRVFFARSLAHRLLFAEDEPH